MVSKLKAIIKHGDKGVEGLLLRDPSTIAESEFRKVAMESLGNLFPEYIIFPFSYDITYNFKTFRPDIALVKKDLSHWFIGEIEIYGHNLEKHIIPQLECFKHGEISKTAFKSIARYVGINSERAKTFIHCIPRQTLLVTNYSDRKWGLHCARREISLIQIEIFFSLKSKEIVTQVYGGLYHSSTSLGFGVSFPNEKTIKCSTQINLKEGQRNIYTDRGFSRWFIKKEKKYTSLIKLNGNLEFPAGAAIQLIQDSNKNITLLPALRGDAYLRDMYFYKTVK